MFLSCPANRTCIGQPATRSQGNVHMNKLLQLTEWIKFDDSDITTDDSDITADVHNVSINVSMKSQYN